MEKTTAWEIKVSRVDKFIVNVYGTLNVVLAALQVNAELIFASTREIYGETRGEVSSEAAGYGAEGSKGK